MPVETLEEMGLRLYPFIITIDGEAHEIYSSQAKAQSDASWLCQHYTCEGKAVEIHDRRVAKRKIA